MGKAGKYNAVDSSGTVDVEVSISVSERLPRKNEIEGNIGKLETFESVNIR